MAHTAAGFLEHLWWIQGSRSPIKLRQVSRYVSRFAHGGVPMAAQWVPMTSGNINDSDSTAKTVIFTADDNNHRSTSHCNHCTSQPSPQRSTPSSTVNNDYYRSAYHPPTLQTTSIILVHRNHTSDNCSGRGGRQQPANAITVHVTIALTAYNDKNHSKYRHAS
jgi:hypothetical protein